MLPKLDSHFLVLIHPPPKLPSSTQWHFTLKYSPFDDLLHSIISNLRLHPSGVAVGFCGQSISAQLFLFTHKAWQMLRGAVSCHLSQLWPNWSFPLWIAKYGIFPRESTRWGVHMLLTNGQRSLWVMLTSYWQKGWWWWWCAPLPSCCSNGWSLSLCLHPLLVATSHSGISCSGSEGTRASRWEEGCPQKSTRSFYQLGKLSQ